jgi:DNA-3-methyladenine glycosylase
VAPAGHPGSPGRDFFNRPADQVAPGLLGWVLEHQTAQGLVAVELTEVEAYLGQSDPASHSYRGPTGRNAVMFGPPGYAYVYFTYGMHFCVNVVCQPPGTATAVLLRAGRIVAGETLARRRRSARRAGAAVRPAAAVGADAARPDRSSAATGETAPGETAPGEKEAAAGVRAIPFRDLARGPARLCQALDITRSHNGADLFDQASPLRLRPPDPPSASALPSASARPSASAPPSVVSSGPRVGVSTAAEVPWRFWVTGDPTVSVYRPSPRLHR